MMMLGERDQKSSKTSKSVHGTLGENHFAPRTSCNRPTDLFHLPQFFFRLRVVICGPIYLDSTTGSQNIHSGWVLKILCLLIATKSTAAVNHEKCISDMEHFQREFSSLLSKTRNRRQDYYDVTASCLVLTFLAIFR